MKLTTRTQKAMLVARKYPQPKEQQQKHIPTLSEWEYSQTKNRIWKTKEIIINKPTKKTEIMGTKLILTPEVTEQIAIAVLSHLNAMQKPTKGSKGAKKETKKSEPKAKAKTSKNNKSSVEMLQYSEKSYVVIGDTKPIKEILKKNGGRFSPFLTINGEKTAGWIFNLKNAEKVEKVLNKYYAK